MDKFNVFIPFELVKGGEATDKKGKKQKMCFKGVASTMKTGKDMDGETLDPNGFDYAQLLKSGHINWNHQASKDPMAIVGEPTAAKVVNNEFHIEGFLYNESELAQKIYKAAEMLEKSGSTRRLGFSIEGNATERDPLNKKFIKKANIMNVAICPTPKNAGTFMSLVKGVEFDYQEDSEYLVDVVNGDERVLIDKSFNVVIFNKNEKVVTNDEFEKSVIAISDAIKENKVISGLESIKEHIASFRQSLNNTVWIGGTIH